MCLRKSQQTIERIKLNNHKAMVCGWNDYCIMNITSDKVTHIIECEVASRLCPDTAPWFSWRSSWIQSHHPTVTDNSTWGVMLLCERTLIAEDCSNSHNWLSLETCTSGKDPWENFSHVCNLVGMWYHSNTVWLKNCLFNKQKRIVYFWSSIAMALALQVVFYVHYYI